MHEPAWGGATTSCSAPRRSCSAWQNVTTFPILTKAMKSVLIAILFTVLVLAACAPQAELVRTRSDVHYLSNDVKATKERLQELQKRLDLLDTNVKGTTDLQKVVADTGVRFDQLTTDLQILQGKIEENNFRIAELAQKMDDRGFKIAELTAKVDELETKFKALGEGGAAAGEQAKKPAAPQALSPTEVYRQAKGDYDAGNFDLAIEGFRNYLKQFPDASQAASARYWIGESYYSKKDYPKAIENFTLVLKNHPKSEKAAAAQLKTGFSYLNEKNPAKAKEHLNKVIKDYPNTKEAALAKDRLGKIGK